jgi:hypothetical protein
MRIWKARAAEKLGVVDKREMARKEYRDGLRDKWGSVGDVGKLERYVLQLLLLSISSFWSRKLTRFLMQTTILTETYSQRRESTKDYVGCTRKEGGESKIPCAKGSRCRIAQTQIGEEESYSTGRSLIILFVILFLLQFAHLAMHNVFLYQISSNAIDFIAQSFLSS